MSESYLSKQRSQPVHVVRIHQQLPRQHPKSYTMTVSNGARQNKTLTAHPERAADTLGSNTDRRKSLVDWQRLERLS